MRSDKTYNNQFNKRKMGITFHNLPCCQDRWVIRWFLYLRLLLFGEILLTCPICKNTKRYILISHVVSDPTSDLNKNNTKNIAEGKKIWRRG